MFCEAAKHLFQQIELQRWNPSGPWTWGDNISFFPRSLLDLVWNGFVYARFWRFNCLVWHYNTACRSASVALFCSESAGNTARAAEKQTVGEQQNINSTWPGSPGETISFRLVNCEFTERPPYFADILLRWMGYTPSTNLPQNRKKLIFETKPFSLGVIFVLGRFSGAWPSPNPIAKLRLCAWAVACWVQASQLLRPGTGPMGRISVSSHVLSSTTSSLVSFFLLLYWLKEVLGGLFGFPGWCIFPPPKMPEICMILVAILYMFGQAMNSCSPPFLGSTVTRETIGKTQEK